MPRRSVSRLRVLLLAAASFSARPVLAQSASSTPPTIVKGSDTGSISITVNNAANSIAPLANAGIAVDAPAYFKVTNMQSAPSSLAVGASRTYTINYQIYSVAPDGAFNVRLTPVTTTPNVIPSVDARAETIPFVVSNSSPVISVESGFNMHQVVGDQTGNLQATQFTTFSLDIYPTGSPVNTITLKCEGPCTGFNESDALPSQYTNVGTDPPTPVNYTVAPSTLAAGGTSGNLPVGKYVLTVGSINGAATTVSWEVVAMTISLASNPGSADYVDGSTDQFDAEINFGVASSLSLQGDYTYFGPMQTNGIPDDAGALGPDYSPELNSGEYPDIGTINPSGRVLTAVDSQGDAQSYVFFTGLTPGPAGGGASIPSGDSDDEIYSSPTSLVSSIYLGGLAYAGNYTDPNSGYPYSTTPLSVSVSTNDMTDGPIGSYQEVADVQLYLMTGDSPGDLSISCILASGTVGLNTSGGISIDYSEVTEPTQTCALGNYYQVALQFDVDSPTAILPLNCTTVDPDDSSYCDAGYAYGLASFSGNAQAYEFVVMGNDPSSYTYGAVSTGTTSAQLGFNLSASSLTVTSSGTFTASYIGTPLPPTGYTAPSVGLGYGIYGSAVLGAPFQVQADYGYVGLASSQESQLQIAFYAAGSSGTYSSTPAMIAPSAINTSSHTATFTAPSYGMFQFVVPVFSSSSPVVSNGEFSFTSAQTGLSISNLSGDYRYRQFLNVLASQGVTLVSSRTWSVSPQNASLSPSALVQINYSTGELHAADVSSATLYAAQYSLATGVGQSLVSSSVNSLSQSVTGFASSISSDSIFAVFSSTPPVGSTLDLLPPQTTLLADGVPVLSGGAVAIPSSGTLSLSAVDTQYAAPVSGVASTFYLIDQPFVSTTTTPGVSYSSFPFVPDVGTHFVRYYSVDESGNYEAVNVATVTVTSATAPTYGGLGAAFDPSGQLWTVTQTSGAVALSRNNSSAVFIASVTLPNADPSYPWSVVFDASGNPYAIGSSIGLNGADKVSVYAAATSGSALVSSNAYDSGFNNNNEVFAASKTWIVGSVQTTGPIDESTATRSYSLAIWSVNPTTHLAALTTSYTRAGFDVGTGLAIDAAGRLWISGFSQSRAPRSPRTFDLAVWEYASDGHTLLGGPYIREGYLNDFDTSQLAVVALSTTAVYVAAPRANISNQTNLEFIQFSTNGVVLAESAWQSGDGAPVFPSSLFLDASGLWDAAGGFNEPDGTLAGIWRYSTAATLQSVNQLDAGGVRASAPNSNGLWLLVDASTSPALDAGETAAAGAFADVEPPRSSLVAGTPSLAGSSLYVSSNTVMALNAVDDGYAVDDSSGVGVQTTYFSLNGSAYQPVNSSFSRAAEGVSTVTYYSVDVQGNAEVPNTATISVDLSSPSATFISSGTGYAITANDPVSHGVASGVAGINYYLDSPPASCAGVVFSSTSASGTCANPVYTGRFFLSTGTAVVYYQAYDNVGNYGAWKSSVVVVGAPGPSVPSVVFSTAAAPTTVYTGEVFNATATGSGFPTGGALAAVQIKASSGSWTSNLGLPYAAKEGTVTLLPNGTVVAAGGYNSSGNAVANAALYDPALGVWKALPSMNYARALFSAVALANGNLLVFGGAGSSGSALATAEIYSPSSGTWMTTGSLSNAREGMKSVLMSNGKVLAIGGYASGGALSSCEVYNPNSGTWSTTASLNTARGLETALLLNDGTVLAAGGTNGSSSLSSAEVYSSSASAWTTVGAMSYARENLTSALLPNGTVLVAGGSGTSVVGQTEIYSSTTTKWSLTGSLNTARTLHDMAVTGQGAAFVIAGQNSSGNQLSSMEYYNTQSGTWSLSATLPGTLEYVRAARLYSGAVLLGGGQSGGQPVSSSTLYTPYINASLSAASNVAVDTSDVAGSLNLSGAATGYWALTLTTPDGRVGMFSPGLFVSADTSAPTTTLTLDGNPISSATLSVLASDTFGFVAVDTGSGVAQTTYAIDGATTAYSNPFSIAYGAHVLKYASTDRAGNVESIHTTSVTVAGLGRASGGSGLGVDASSLLWSVAYASATVAVAHTSPFGPFMSSTTLPNADPAYPWSVFFDTAGNAYAIGAALGTNGADQVAVDLVAPSGSALVSTTSYDSGYSNNNLVFSAAPSGSGTAWIVGAVQTAGPIGSGAGTRSYSLAIWSYNPGTGQVALTTSTTRAGYDIATGVAVDGSGNLWISGYSLSPNPLSGNVFDLAVWEYASDGHTLLAGPFLRTQYLANFDTQMIASIIDSSGTVFVAAPRGNATGGVDAGFTVFTSSGQVVAESAWQSGDGSSAYPSTLVQDSYGNPVAAGVFVYSDGTIAGVWRYATSGTLASAAQVDAGGARGAAYDAGKLWLMVDASTVPFQDSGETAIAGAFIDIQPPRTAFYPGTPNYATSTVTYIGDGLVSGLVAVDDGDAVGDGFGVGVSSTFIAIDTAPYSVYSGTFSLVAEGTHTVSFFSVDFDTNVEVAHSSSVAVDLTAPITTLQVAGPSDPSAEYGYVVSTATVFSLSAVDPVSRGVASGVAETYYVIDSNPFSAACQIVGLDPTQPNGTCANEAYDGGFTLSVGTHTIYYFSEDEAENQETLNIASVTVSTGVLPDVTGISPSSGPIGTSFLITGSGFGAYSSTASLVTFNGISAPIAVWLSTAVSGSVPGTSSSGTARVLIQSVSGASVVQSSAPAFFVDVPYISTITPNSGPTGTGVMLGGYGFGSYNGSESELLVAGSSVSLSVWIDTEIVWTVPSSLTASTVAVVVSLTPAGGSVMSNSVSFTVTSGGGGGGGMARSILNLSAPLPLSAMPDYYFLGDMRLSAATGGVLQTPSGAALQVPPFAVASNTVFTMGRVTALEEPIPANAAARQRLTPVGQAVQFGPSNAALARSVTLVLPYDPTLLTAAELGSLEIYSYDPNANLWSALPTQVSAGAHVLTAQTSHFSLYEPLILSPQAGGPAAEAFGLRARYAFPNPSNHGAPIDFRLQPGLADSVDLHIYNAAGRRILTTTINSANTIDDGNGLGPQDTYDYIWAVGGVGSGVYTYVFVAHKSGEADIVATGKAAVIK